MNKKLVIFVLLMLLTSSCANEAVEETETPSDNTTEAAPSPSAPAHTAQPSATPSLLPAPTKTEPPGDEAGEPDEMLRPEEEEVLLRFPDARKRSQGVYLRGYEDYSDNNVFRYDLDGDGVEDVLLYKTAPLDAADGNKPTRVTLRVGGVEAVFESEWNDDLALFIEDFDEDDQYMDICITRFGTDIGCSTHIFRYDGSSITEYASFSHVTGNTLYLDGQGSIYYVMPSYDGGLEVSEYFDYRERVSKPLPELLDSI